MPGQDHERRASRQRPRPVPARLWSPAAHGERRPAHGAGAKLCVPAKACTLREHEGHHPVTLKEGATVRARTLLIVTGVRYRRLLVPDLERFEATGVYYAATAFEAQTSSRDPVVVVGGGNSAGQAALFLAHHVASVRLLVRDGELTGNMSRYLAVEIGQHPGPGGRKGTGDGRSESARR
jgi:thioredoxin reductase